MRLLRKYVFWILVLFLMPVGLYNCQPCDDCEISPAPKQVMVVDKNNNNLVFGPSARYNPDDITIRNESGELVEFFTNTVNQSIDFTFRVTSNSYFLALNSTDTDTIMFLYGKDRNVDCCNEFDVTKSTFVNGKATSNDDQITIVKP